jgi:hypothetical protein
MAKVRREVKVCVWGGGGMGCQERGQECTSRVFKLVYENFIELALGCTNTNQQAPQCKFDTVYGFCYDCHYY